MIYHLLLARLEAVGETTALPCPRRTQTCGWGNVGRSRVTLAWPCVLRPLTRSGGQGLCSCRFSLWLFTQSPDKSLLF